MKAFKTALLFLSIALFLGSCGVSKKVAESGPVQQRKYLKGYHLNGIEKGSETQKSKSARKENRDTAAPSDRAPRTEVAPESVSPEKTIEKEYSNSSSEAESDTDECAVIIKRDGEEIKAEVKTVGTEKIEYKKCERQEGPTYEIEKGEVFMIKYPDGSKDVFEEGPEESSSSDKDESPKGEKEDPDKGSSASGTIGFIFAMLALFLIPISILTGIAGLFWAAIAFSFLGFILSLSGEGGLATAGGIINGLILTGVLILIGIGLAFGL